jgi:glutaredoxin
MVTLYSNDCPKCKILKSKLENKNIQYDLCSDIDIMILKGFQTTPVLQIDDKTMTYLDAINWVKEQ